MNTYLWIGKKISWENRPRPSIFMKFWKRKRWSFVLKDSTAWLSHLRSLGRTCILARVENIPLLRKWLGPLGPHLWGETRSCGTTSAGACPHLREAGPHLRHIIRTCELAPVVLDSQVRLHQNWCNNSDFLSLNTPEPTRNSPEPLGLQTKHAHYLKNTLQTCSWDQITKITSTTMNLTSKSWNHLRTSNFPIFSNTVRFTSFLVRFFPNFTNSS